MAIAAHIKDMMGRGSFIRKMFEVGTQLKKVHGAENVFDFTLGNPNLEPPRAFEDALLRVVQDPIPLKHAYMPNAGYPDVRRAVAEYVSKEYGTNLTENHIVMTCGAGGALNCVLKTLLNPLDTLIGIAPYFVEYSFYASNHGGTFVAVDSKPDFDLNVDTIASAITKNTAAVIINSPNNPTGKIYPESTLMLLGKMLEQRSKQLNRTIYLIMDEPYRKIVFDAKTIPSVFKAYRNTIVCTSYSKDLSLPGERIGWIAVSSTAEAVEELMNGIILCTRVLGFVNAPALMQRAIKQVQGISCDISLYAKNRNLFCDNLIPMGYELVKPDGAFYLFPKAPGGDDQKFVDALQEELILAVPGTGFGKPGYFRLVFCCDSKSIERSLPGFERAFKKFK